MIDRDHPLVGFKAVYSPAHGGRREEGVVTAVSADARAVFVKYGADATSKNTPVDALTNLDGEALCLDSRVCNHVFAGWRELDGGRGGERVCRKCGLGAMAHTLSQGF